MQTNSDLSNSVDRDSYAVATVGFEEHERLLLRDILGASEKGLLVFRSYQAQQDGQPAVVIVNGDDADAVTQWGKLEQARAPSATPMSIIYLSRGNPPADASYSLGRPFVATQLFDLLERVVTERHGYQLDFALAADDISKLTNADEQPSASAPSNEMAPEVLAPAVEKMPDVPMQSVDETPAVSEVRESPPERHHRALVVDDSLPVRIQLRAPLEKTFQHVDIVDSGEEALELLARYSYDLVLLDAFLPGIDGYETCERIKNDTRHVDTPVVMLTSKSSPVDKVKGKLVGCETYLIKPVKKAVFETVLQGLFSTRAA